MIDFNSSGFFARLKKVNNDQFGKMIEDLLIDNVRSFERTVFFYYFQ